MRLKRIVISLILLGAGLFTYSSPVLAAPTLVIDNKVRNIDPPPHISHNRTMVPIRFIVEDESIRGEIFWNQSLGKVAMNCRGQYIELFIGSNQAAVDGKTLYLDAPAYIYAGRTYVPLRFIAEAMGARVDYEPAAEQVIIDFSPPAPRYDPLVFAYYYYRAFDELQANAHLFTDIAFRWFQTDGLGRLFYEYEDDYDNILQYTRDQGIKAHASVVLMDGDQLHQLLAHPKNRANLIGNLLEVVKEKNYDGVDIDFEFIKPADGPYFTLFLQELKTALGPGKQLSAAVFARTESDHWATPYEYAKIGGIVDLLVIMAYDYSCASTPAGPIAPLWWAEKVVDYMAANMGRDKILLGMPTYGYDWAGGVKAVTITGPKLALLEQTCELKAAFDQQSYSPFYTYYDKEGRLHHIWMEDYSSLKAKYDLAMGKKLAGISFWRIGNGFTDLYRVIEEQR